MKISTAPFFVILLAINLIGIYFFKIKLTVKDVLIIYCFLFIVFFLTDLIQSLFLTKVKTPIYLLLGVNFFRIFLCVLFLFPTILNYEKCDNIYVVNFFLVYFFMLFSDIFSKFKSTIK